MLPTDKSKTTIRSALDNWATLPESLRKHITDILYHHDDVSGIKKITGKLVNGEAVVEVWGNPLENSRPDKSPTGFSWGYNGSGPAALAHSILSVVATPEIADECYQQFKFDVIGRLPDKDWELSFDTVKAWLENNTGIQ